MDKNKLSDQSERYRNELLKLYGKRSAADLPPEETEPPKLPDNSEKADDTAYFPHNDAEDDSDADDFNDRFPAPDITDIEDSLSDTVNDSPPEYVTEESMGSETGYILVNVRTGDESSPIEGATVLVTAILGGNRLILAEGVTDSSGTVGKFSVPAPDDSFSQSPETASRPYSLYDVSVTAEGFFNARSVDVPVFAGITSVQNFSMIPVPAMMRQDDETVTYFNQEPATGTGSN